MASEEIVTEMVDRSRSKPRWHILVGDFANIVKAFMGSNYLTIAYGFKQSGLVLGLVGLLVIAFITDHCCDLIVKCKYHAIQFVLDRQINSTSSLSSLKTDSSLKPFEKSEDETERSRQESAEIIKHMTRSITYGDIGKLACGRFGAFIVNACVIFTQFGFCIGYCIFIGNTLFSLFPSTNVTLNTGVTQPSMATYVSSMTSENISTDYTQNNESLLTDNVDYSMLMQNNESSEERDEISLVTLVSNSSIPPKDNSSSYILISDAPDLRLLVISPLPVFFVFALLKSVRHLGFVSVGADVSLFLGCIVTMIYISIDFQVSSSWELFNLKTFPIFFGMTTASYEGIGTIIPIECSMEGNRHNFSKFLHGAVLILTFILTVFGTMGYLANGDATEQMLNKHIPASDGFGVAINIFLCIGVVLTFPLQVYPVTELLEIYLFRPGAIFGRGKFQTWWRRCSEDKLALLPKNELVVPSSAKLNAMDEIPNWKRNLLRLFVVLFAAGIAVLMRNLFAYVSAFIGAVGSSLLAYVLPCIFHLRLCWHKLGYGIRIKDICIIVFGVVASLVSLYTTILEVLNRV
ncbi:unnamed protein product [Candidula unifasciata]|uniref:Amino acid transporter transmembrane domain-containing protein n=1 Tax=Candidula unifasciata TaxID=100452 RepID=A0A8S3YP98_9EUPU|nr:unnamed protein product [Candidula unifasciata]